jgi:cell division protease FtsH
VAGVDEARQELEEVVDFLKHPKEYCRPGAHIPEPAIRSLTADLRRE